jgi:hypothetical protein
MAKEYGRLELLQPITAKGGKEAHEVVIYRPTCKQMTEVLDGAENQVERLERFVSKCCRALNGSAEPLEFPFGELNSADGADIGSIVAAMSDDASKVSPEIIGDGITEPLLYTLQTPLKVSPKEDSEVVRQLMFEAKRVRDISDYLDASGATAEFHTFMRAFAKPLGLAMPLMTDILIDALDFLDYLVIRNTIMGKFVNSRKRWKRVS